MVDEKDQSFVSRLLSVFTDRLNFFSRAGLTFEGRRDYNRVLGYPNLITVAMYREAFLRWGIATRVIDALPKATWRGDMTIADDEDPEKNTPFEQTFKQWATKIKLNAYLQRADTLSRISEYGVLLLGNPNGKLETELDRGNGTPDSIQYLAPYMGSGGPGLRNEGIAGGLLAVGPRLGFSYATIKTLVTDTTSPRFGLPETYMLNSAGMGLQAENFQRPVHWSRIIHLADGCLDNEIYAPPQLENIWNNLIDLIKVTGGGTEAYWKRADRGLQINVDKDMKLAGDEGEKAIKDLRAQVEEFIHDQRRVFQTRGVEMKDLGSQVSGFAEDADALYTQIAGSKAIPKRILTGSEMGELASSQDRENWRDQVIGRQTSYAGPFIVRQLVDRLIQYNYLPVPNQNDYHVVWPHIQVLTEDEKAKGAQTWASTNRTQGKTIFTAEEIRKKWYDLAPLEPEQIEEIGAPAPAPSTDGFTPSQRAAMAHPDEMQRLLEDAIAAKNAELVLKIVGIQ